MRKGQGRCCDTLSAGLTLVLHTAELTANATPPVGSPTRLLSYLSNPKPLAQSQFLLLLLLPSLLLLLLCCAPRRAGQQLRVRHPCSHGRHLRVWLPFCTPLLLLAGSAHTIA